MDPWDGIKADREGLADYLETLSPDDWNMQSFRWELPAPQHAFTVAHFERWLDLFGETVDEGWTGLNADKVKGLATNVAQAPNC